MAPATGLADITPGTAVAAWLERFAAALARQDAEAAAALFLPDGHWRDAVALSWDIVTLNGRAAIAAALAQVLPTARPTRLHLPAHRAPPRRVTRAGTSTIEAIFGFETASGRASGVLRLLPDPAAGGALRAWVLLTALDEIKGHEERIGDRRSGGEAYSREFGGANWLDHRNRPAPMPTHDPTALVVGGGQCRARHRRLARPDRRRYAGHRPARADRR